MAYPEVHYRWTWKLAATPAQLWPFVADTNRFNRDVGLPAVEAARVAGATPGRRRLRFAKLRVRFEWDEEPFEWQRPGRFGVLRTYRSGPLATLRVLVRLSPAPAGGTILTYETWVRPRSLLGWATLPLAMGLRNRLRFGRAFRAYDKRAAAAGTPALSHADAAFSSGGAERLLGASWRLLAEGADPVAVGKLIDHMRDADEFALARIRPYELADAWGLERRAMLDACLRATRAGLLDLRWDVLCPLCRGAAQSAGSLAEIGQQVHCETCNIDLASNLEDAVELTFSVNDAVRHAVREAFCVAGPQVTPHVVAQQLLAPGERRTLHLALEPGRYRLRAVGRSGGEYVNVAADGASTARLALPAEEAAAPPELGPLPELTLVNNDAATRLLVFEHLAWADDAATAAEVIRLQTFRDLFGQELLRPGQEIKVESLTIVFTDLRDSTRLYQQIGDASAFGCVLDHFDVLREEVVAAGGALVKTIGDAVMAVFPQPATAIEAMLKAQDRLATRVEGPRIVLKAGMHAGPCIAVTLNQRLDYFGTTVNLASRLEHFSNGNDVIVSDAVHADPAVAALLMSRADLDAESFEEPVKGFDDGPLRLWRIARAPA